MAFLLDDLDQKIFENQRSVVKNERRQSYEDRPYGFSWKILREQVFPPLGSAVSRRDAYGNVVKAAR
jgi:predicted Zn-dependent peptidase